MAERNLKAFTTLRIGGRARVIEANTTESLIGHEGLVIGGGSNLLVLDNALPTFIINKTKGVECSGRMFYAKSGEKISLLSERACRLGLSGLEWATGLPGTVGGAIFGNAGAGGACVSDCLMYADIYQQGKIVRKSVRELGFSYRASAIIGVIVGACFLLERANACEIAKRQKTALARRASQPKGKSAGCVFRNPTGDYAGRLIESVGLKGKRVGGAEVSTKHANFIINRGDATANDVLQLIKLVERAVLEHCGVVLEREIKIIGE